MNLSEAHSAVRVVRRLPALMSVETRRDATFLMERAEKALGVALVDQVPGGPWTPDLGDRKRP